MASAPIKPTQPVQIPPLFQWSPRGQHLRKRRRRSVKRSTSFYIEGVKTGPTKPNLFQNTADDPSFQQSLTFPSLFPFTKFLPSFIHSKFFKTLLTTCYNFLLFATAVSYFFPPEGPLWRLMAMGLNIPAEAKSNLSQFPPTSSWLQPFKLLLLRVTFSRRKVLYGAGWQGS